VSSLSAASSSSPLSASLSASLASSSWFWVKGSASQCDSSYGNIANRRDLHINGNALFRIGDKHFNAFLKRVQAFYPPYTDASVGIGGCSTGHSKKG
jgi:hypothetical protein